MTTSDEARDVLRGHFASVSDSDYRDELERHSPELLSGADSGDAELARVGLPNLQTEDAPDALALFASAPAHPPLNAYLASALTGLSSEQRHLVFQLSDTVSVVSHELGINLYEPRKNTDPVHHADVSDSEVFHIDRERVINSDLLIYLAHYPSTGAGEELDIAYNAMVPILVISHADAKVSRMVTGIPGLVVSLRYREPEELRALLREQLAQLRPLLVQRKLAFGDYDVNIVGDRIRKLRESQGFTRDDLARVSSDRCPISVETLARIEESTDRDANPSLLQLREIATTLKTSVADLVEPDLEENIIASLGNWVGERQAARFSGISHSDRNRILRRLLLRLIDSLEEDD